jgi:integration host factor subunit beta
MTKSELIQAIAARADIAHAQAEMIVDLIFDEMSRALVEGRSIEIRGFGSFSPKPYGAYVGHNPRTGTPVQVASKRLPFFRVGKELRELVAESIGITNGKSSTDCDPE